MYAANGVCNLRYIADRGGALMHHTSIASAVQSPRRAGSL